jgi:hypothetical protein
MPYAKFYPNRSTNAGKTSQKLLKANTKLQFYRNRYYIKSHPSNDNAIEKICRVSSISSYKRTTYRKIITYDHM